jgi:hypothetical protein
MIEAAASPIEPQPSVADLRLGPGVLVFSASLQLLRMDRRAWELCRIINQAQNPKVRDGVLPSPVADLCADVLKLLTVRTGAKDWEHCGSGA